MNKNHKRIISARFKIIARDIEEMMQIIQNVNHTTLEPVEDIISKRDSEKIFKVMDEIRQELENITNKYQLPVHPKSQKSMIIARLSEMHDTIIDLHSKKLMGYGDFNRGLESSYNQDIDKLEGILNKALKIF